MISKDLFNIFKKIFKRDSAELHKYYYSLIRCYFYLLMHSELISVNGKKSFRLEIKPLPKNCVIDVFNDNHLRPPQTNEDGSKRYFLSKNRKEILKVQYKGFKSMISVKRIPRYPVNYVIALAVYIFLFLFMALPLLITYSLYAWFKK